MNDLSQEIATAAARLIVEDGMDYGAAKRQALRQLGLPSRTPLPTNDRVEGAVREHIAVFCQDRQPSELLALRRLALRWMQRLAPFRPYLDGAVWHGTATRHSDVVLHLFCDDPKSAEIALIDMGLRFGTGGGAGASGDEPQVLSLTVPCPELGEPVGLHLLVRDHNDLRGALKPDPLGRAPRGDAVALARLLDNPAA